MPTPFSQFRYLDARDKNGPRPSVIFQAQRKVKKTGLWDGSRTIPRTAMQHGVLYVWQTSATDDWKSPDWLNDEEKRIIVQETRDFGGGNVEVLGYAIVQDPCHLEPVAIASLAIWGPDPICHVSGWLIAPSWQEDPNLEIEPWAQFQQKYDFLPEPV